MNNIQRHDKNHVSGPRVGVVQLMAMAAAAADVQQHVAKTETNASVVEMLLKLGSQEYGLAMEYGLAIMSII